LIVQIRLNKVSCLYFRLGATLTILRDRTVVSDEDGTEKRALEILVRKIPDDQKVGFLNCLTLLS